MRFNSLIYLILLAAVVLPLLVIPVRQRRNWLLLSSYVFYGLWIPPFLALLIGVATLNHFGAVWIVAAKDRKRRGTIIVAANLALLVLFKYLRWGVANVNWLGQLLGCDLSLSLPKWLLPLGISFYIFEGISYTVDIMRKREKVHGFWDFQLFIAFFPKLIAGPILRAKEFLPQIENPVAADRAQQIFTGLWNLGVGLFVKIVLADNLAILVNEAFDRANKNIDALGSFDVWLMAAGFGLQIYFDFSSYSRLAIGSAQLCGIQLVQNFNFPYSAGSPVEFWNRWHMSLSRWIRDYLFFPLVGKKASLWALCRAALIAMTLCGLWHGAKWTYVFWGFYHGLLIAMYHVLTFRSRNVGNATVQSSNELEVSQLKQVVGWFVSVAAILVTYAAITLGWLAFRADNLTQTLTLMERALTPWIPRTRALAGSFYAQVALLLIWIWAIPLVIRLWKSMTADRPEFPLGRDVLVPILQGVTLGAMIVLCLLYHQSQSAFIYFQF